MRILIVALAFLTLPLPGSANSIRKLDVFATDDVASLPDGRVVALVERGLVVLDAEGNVRGAVGLPSPAPTTWTSVAAGPGGELVVVSGGDGSISVMKLTSDLRIAWSRKYTPFISYPVVDVTVAADGDIVVFGSQTSRALILRLQPSGEVRWASLYDQPQTDRFQDALPLADGGLILTGIGGSQPWMIRVAADGTVAWQRRWAVPAAAGSLDAVERMHDGNFLAAGRVDRNLVAVKVDEHGREIWTKQGPEASSVKDIVAVRDKK